MRIILNLNFSRNLSNLSKLSIINFRLSRRNLKLLRTSMLKRLKLRTFSVGREAECCRNQSIPSMILTTTTSLLKKMILFQPNLSEVKVTKNHSGNKKTLHF